MVSLKRFVILGNALNFVFLYGAINEKFKYTSGYVIVEKETLIRLSQLVIQGSKDRFSINIVGGYALLFYAVRIPPFIGGKG